MKDLFRKIIGKPHRIIAAIIAVIMIGSIVAVIVPGKETVAEDKYPIMGPSNVSVGQLMNYYNSVASYPGYYGGTDAPTLDSFCQMYIDECNAEGVRVEVAFCQAMNETNYLKFTGRVPIEAKNFAGIGATDSTQDYNVFGSVRDGIRAQVQHLKAYACTDGLNNPCVDPRFHLVSRGCAPYLEDLSGKWASSPTYGYDIRYNFMAKLGTFNGFTTMYNGVEYNMVYDPNYYLAHYSDVRAYFANDGYALIAHFVNNGINEGRQANDWFNVDVYKNNYVDLRNAYGYDTGSYIRHYVFLGCAEGRQGWIPNGSTDKVTMFNGVNYSSIYDYNYYTAHNLDVKAAYGNDDITTLVHFILCGMNEGRRASAEFDVNSYRNEYPDLRTTYGKNVRSYYEHYMNYGKREGRHGTGCNTLVGGVTKIWIFELSDVYDYGYYSSHNPDLAEAFGSDDIAMLEHFVNYGVNEGRQAKESFNVMGYKNRHLDLRRAYGNNLSQYYWHYVSSGKAEGRDASYTSEVTNPEHTFLGIDCSPIYNYNYYQEHNSDVKKAFGNDDIATFIHFLTSGMKEGRRACAGFDLQTYANNNPDLFAAYFFDLPAYYLHYLNYGLAEGRIAV